MSSILKVVESSVKIMCESSEDMTSPSEIMILKFPSSNMSIAFLDSSIENQKEDTLNLIELSSLNTVSPVAPLLSLSGTLSLLGSLLSVPFHCLFHIDECHRLTEAARSMDDEPSLMRIS